MATPMHRTLCLAAACVLAAGTVGCATKAPALYQWGGYQDMVYARYGDPGKVPVAAQIERLEADLQQGRAVQKPMPPGYLAHLGTLYFEAGRTDEARRAFESEKAAFPESASYMDRLIKQIRK